MNSASFSTTTLRPPTLSILPSPPQNSSTPIPQHNIQFKPNHLTHQPSIFSTKEKLNTLVTEFKSLPEPIDRVKRLLHYATLLPELNKPCRVEQNRVTGCTAQVWLKVGMDGEGLMRFNVDSDSEITKGFCYCLVWLLDGAAPCDVCDVKVDDLGEINVGILPVRVSSRVITWHNVLLSMQRRTRDLVMENCGGDCSCLSLLL